MSDGSFSYSYNAAGRLISATANGQTISYGYDAIGQRITKTVAETPPSISMTNSDT